jgi:sugar phosphate isomerase/epimerase
MIFKLGLIVNLVKNQDEVLTKVHNLGFQSCQVACWNFNLLNMKNAIKIKEISNEKDIEITTIWAGMPGKNIWNFTDGPDTIGLVPMQTRKIRLKALKKASDFARILGVKSITTHVGFIPENPTDPLYISLIPTIRDIASFCGYNEQEFWFETGQETPITLLRLIEDVGSKNLGINFDPANLLMYGKANPSDALEILDKYVKGFHAKDGEYPKNGKNLGEEKPLGEGSVNFPLLISKLVKMQYSGALTIEREITGPQQIKDIKRAKRYLEKILYSFKMI